MNRPAILYALVLCVSAASARQIMFQEPLSRRIANYEISVTLDTDEKTLAGKQTLVWKNPSRDRITELQFHLYLNAFKNSESTFMKGSGGRHRGIEMGREGWGWIDVTSMRVRNGEELTPKIEFIQPDDGNTHDRTVFRVPLANPVGPNETIALDIEFRAKLPRVFSRTGHHRDFFMVAQWFPKIGVYEPAGMRYATKGQWNCHQFHVNTEFYADFGVYDVDITLPSGYVVGATGVLQKEKENGDGTKTLSYRAEDVHDFAWTASPRYRVLEDQWEHVAIRLLLQPEHLGFADRYLQSTKAALRYFNDWVGKYPYPILTVVDPPAKASGAGGMEYPTLITGGSYWGLPAGLRAVELVTIHEFGHQYWYGMIANNEFEEAWIDEGINSYYEARIVDEVYGRKTSVVDLLGLRIGDRELARAGYAGMSNPKIAPTATNAWQFDAGGYGTLTYQKTATFLATLERLIGRPAMDEAMRTFFERWKFNHPSGRDFIAVVNEVVLKHHGDRFGPGMDWFFDQVLFGTDVCDYEATSISNRRVRSISGVVDRAGEKALVRDTLARTSTELFESRALVSRLGEVTMPVEVLIRFDDGSEVRERWDGKGRWKEFSFRSPHRIEWVKVDPDEVLLIDVNLINNSKTTRPLRAPIWKYTVRFLFWVQNALQYVAFF